MLPAVLLAAAGFVAGKCIGGVGIAVGGTAIGLSSNTVAITLGCIGGLIGTAYSEAAHRHGYFDPDKWLEEHEQELIDALAQQYARYLRAWLSTQ